MDNNIATIGGAIMVAALGAITVVAYKHPKAYGKLFVVLCVVFNCVLWALTGWTLGVGAAHRAALASDAIAPGDIDKMSGAIAALFVPFWIYIALLLLFFYFVVLRTLPSWLLDNSPPAHQDSER